MQDTTQQPQPATSATARVIWVSLVPVAVVAAVGSYLNALSVVQVAEQHRMVAYFVAGLADPVILGSSANIRDAFRHGARLPRWSMVSVGLAIMVTLGFQVAAAGVFTVPPWLVNVWMPVAFLMVLESLMSYTRRGRGTSFPSILSDPPATSSHPQPAAPLSTEAALKALLGSASQRALNELLGVPRSRVQAWAAMVAPVAQNAPAGMAMAVAPHIPGRGPGGHDGPRAAAGDTPAGDASTPLCSPAGAPDRGQGGAEHSSRPEPRPAGVVTPVAAPAGAVNGSGR